MKATYRLIPLALIILIFGVAPVVHAVVPAGDDFSTAETVICGDPPVSYERSIDAAKEIDYYSIDLVTGQVLTIDVDTADNGGTLDSFLEVFDSGGNLIAANDRSSEVPLNEDPYLKITVDLDGTHYLAISAPSGGAGDADADDYTGNIGPYTLLLKCTDPSIPPDPVKPVKVGDLLGATSFDPGSLLSINSADGASTVRFPFEYGKIADVEFDLGSKMLFVATGSSPGSIIVVDPDTGTEIKSFSYDSGGFLALESGENILFGIYVEYDLDGFEKFTLVTIDQATGATSPVALSSTVPFIGSLAYHPGEKVLYGASGANLIKFDLTLSPGEIQKVGSPGLGEIVAVDFSHEKVLYCVDISGTLFRIPDPTLASELPVKVGSIIAATEVATVASATSRAPVSGLTFVVGEAPPDVEPIKTLCSSTLTSSTTASSEIDSPKLSKLKLKHNPLHRAIGLFKFQGKAGEKVTLRLAPEGEEAAVAGEESSVNTWVRSWLKCRGKGRVFLGVRDAIPNVDFRARKKDQMPFDMSADLPEDGYYYVMVIRPLLRFYQTDYCLTLESDHPDSQAWQTLDVVWPGDDSEEDSATTSAEAKTAEVQSDEVYDEGSSGSEDNTPGETAVVVPTLTAVEPVSVAPATSPPEPVEEVSSQEVQAVEETTVDKTDEVAPAEEPTTEAIDEPIVKGAPSIAEETTVDKTDEVAPAEEPTTEAIDEPIVKGAPSIAEETTVDKADEVAPAEEPTTEAIDEPIVKGAPSIAEETAVDKTDEVVLDKSADEISGDDESADGSGSAEVAGDNSDGAESAEGGTSDVVEEDPMLKGAPPMD